jgi:hypothetical protein
MSTISIYQEACKAGLSLDNHESDLYLKECTEARRLVQNAKVAFSYFISQIDGQTWIDVPFAYDPWWAKRHLPHQGQENQQ